MSGADLAALRQKIVAADQSHLLPFLDRSAGQAESRLRQSLAALDWNEVRSLGEKIAEKPAAGGKLEPAPSIKKGRDQGADQRAREIGEALLRQGRVAAFVVAGGQGSRLGFEGPKGIFPASPIRGRSLFELFAAKIRALGRRHGAAIPWYLMTSDTNHAATRDWFASKQDLGIAAPDLRFFKQAMLPAMDLSGRILMAGPDELFLSPNGHGGSLLALQQSGALDEIRDRGIEQIFYFQVDNPLVDMCDPVFLGYHALAGAEMSSKVVAKRDAGEKVGVVGLIDGRHGVIEYSDLSEAERSARRPDGELAFRDGNIAVHVMRRDFVEELTRGGRLDLPYHLARKSIPCLEPDTGRPGKVDGVKFETFVFDALGFCKRSVVLEVERAAEFAPIKNAEGVDSPATSKAAQTALFAAWLQSAGVEVPHDAAGQPFQPIEIDPLFADNAAALSLALGRTPGRRLDFGAPLLLV